MVELLVLLAVVSVLMAIGFPMYLSYSRARITVGPTITFNSVGAAAASGVFRVSNSTSTGGLDVCVAPTTAPAW